MKNFSINSSPQLSIHCGILRPTTLGYKLVTDDEEYNLEIPRYLQSLLPRHIWERTFIRGLLTSDGTIRVQSIWLAHEELPQFA